MRTGELHQRYFGVYLAKVRDTNDPKKLGRVQVEADQFDDEGDPVWASVSRPAAGKGTGVFFTPKPGDQVIIGYLVGDVDEPIVLGYAHSDSAQPSGLVGERAHGIVTDIGSVVFDEAKKTITITFGKGLKESCIKLSDTGVEIKGPMVKIEATGAVIVSGATISLAAPALAFAGAPTFGALPPLPGVPVPPTPDRFVVNFGDAPVMLQTGSQFCVNGKALVTKDFLDVAYNVHVHSATPPYGPTPPGTEEQTTKCSP